MLPMASDMEIGSSGPPFESTTETVTRLRSKVTPFADVRRHIAAILQSYPVTAAVMEGAVMRMNEFVEQVQQGTRLPDMDQAFNDARAKLETRAERRGAAESRRQNPEGREAIASTTRMPRRYGAGF